MATSISDSLTDSDTFSLFEALVTADPPETEPRPEYLQNLRAWRDIECDKMQAEIYRGQERQVHGRAT